MYQAPPGPHISSSHSGRWRVSVYFSGTENVSAPNDERLTRYQEAADSDGLLSHRTSTFAVANLENADVSMPD